MAPDIRPGSLVHGTAVVVSGLKSRADLNGSTGTVLGCYDGRFAVRVTSGDSVRIKAENLALKASGPQPVMTDDVASTLQGATVPQLAWLLIECGPKKEQIAELILLYACTLFSPEMVEQCPAKWSRNGMENVTAFLRAGGHLGVLSAMAAHPRNATVQQRGMQQLMTLVVEEVSQALRSTDVVNAAGGAAAAVAAMAAHERNEEVQTFGCRLLMNLSSSEARGAETAALSAAKSAVVEAGGVAAFARAIAAHPGAEEVLWPALGGAAHVLLDHPAAVEAAFAIGLARPVIHVLDGVRRANADVLVQGCLCLAHLAGGDGAGAAAVVGEGAIPALCKVLRAHGHAPSVVESACVAMHNLAAHGHAPACREAGALPLVDKARRDWPTPAVEMLWGALQVQEEAPPSNASKP